MLDLSGFTWGDFKPLLDLILAHKWETALVLFLSSGVGAQVLVRLLNLLPLAWWYGTVETVFYGISVAGGTRFTRPLWDPVEDWFENFMGKTVDAARRGLRRDNHPTAAGPGPVPAAPEKALEMQADGPPPLHPNAPTSPRID